MVMNFDLTLNPTSIIIFTVITFSWGKGLLLLFLSNMEGLALDSRSYSQTDYVWNYYTKEEFEKFKDVATDVVAYNNHYAIYDASIIVVIVIFEAFHVVWELSQMVGAKFQTKSESVISFLYLLILRTLFFIAYFPITIIRLKVTREAFGGFLSSILWIYIKDLFLISVLILPAFYLIKNFYRSVIFIISAAYFVWIMASAAIYVDFFSSFEPLEDGLLRKTLEEKILPETDFTINDIYYSNDEVDDKVYLIDKWFQKNIVITGPLPVDKNVSLIGDTHGSIQFTTKEVIALIVYRIGESSKGYICSTILSTVVHLFTLMLVCWHLYKRQYVLHMAGFHTHVPVIANLLVIWYFVIQPYWTFVYFHWRCIYDFTQLTEAQFMVSHFGLQKELIRALVKLYHSSNQFPYHNYWYAMLNGYKRPLHTLVISLFPPDAEALIR